MKNPLTSEILEYLFVIMCMFNIQEPNLDILKKFDDVDVTWTAYKFNQVDWNAPINIVFKKDKKIVKNVMCKGCDNKFISLDECAEQIVKKIKHSQDLQKLLKLIMKVCLNVLNDSCLEVSLSKVFKNWFTRRLLAKNRLGNSSIPNIFKITDQEVQGKVKNVLDVLNPSEQSFGSDQRNCSLITISLFYFFSAIGLIKANPNDRTKPIYEKAQEVQDAAKIIFNEKSATWLVDVFSSPKVVDALKPLISHYLKETTKAGDHPGVVTQILDHPQTPELVKIAVQTAKSSSQSNESESHNHSYGESISSILQTPGVGEFFDERLQKAAQNEDIRLVLRENFQICAGPLQSGVDNLFKKIDDDNSKHGFFSKIKTVKYFLNHFFLSFIGSWVFLEKVVFLRGQITCGLPNGLEMNFGMGITLNNDHFPFLKRLSLWGIQIDGLNVSVKNRSLSFYEDHVVSIITNWELLPNVYFSVSFKLNLRVMEDTSYAIGVHYILT